MVFEFFRVCFALPPGVTWDELNASPFTDSDAVHLLHYTMEMNSQIKRNKRRPRNTRSQSMPKDNKAVRSKADDVPIKPTISRSPVKTKTTSKVTSSAVIKDLKTIVTEQEVTQANAISSNDQKKQSIENSVESDNGVVTAKFKTFVFGFGVYCVLF